MRRLIITKFTGSCLQVLKIPASSRGLTKRLFRCFFRRRRHRPRGITAVTPRASLWHAPTRGRADERCRSGTVAPAGGRRRRCPRHPRGRDQSGDRQGASWCMRCVACRWCYRPRAIRLMSGAVVAKVLSAGRFFSAHPPEAVVTGARRVLAWVGAVLPLDVLNEVRGKS